MSEKKIEELCQDLLKTLKEASDCPCDPCICEYYEAEDLLMFELVKKYEQSTYPGELYPRMFKKYGTL